MLSVLVNIVLIWFHPPAISTKLIMIAAVPNVFIWIITASLAIPIHKQLDQAKSAELIDRLVAIHLYLRLVPGLILMVVSGAMMYQALATPPQKFPTGSQALRFGFRKYSTPASPSRITDRAQMRCPG